jgi:spermidine synthase
MRRFNRQAGHEVHDPVEISEKKGIRYLHLGGPAVQSAMRIRDPFALELEYTRAMMAFLLFRPAPERIALIGLGGGSLAKFIHRRLPTAHLTALELNPGVVAAARSYFLLPDNDDRLDVRVADGAPYVYGQDGTLDVLLVDGYDANRIVEALAEPEFYAACLGALRPGGVAVFNLWGSDRMFNTYYERIARIFADHVLILPAEKKGNVQLFAFRPPLPDTRFTVLMPEAERLEMDTGMEMPSFVERMRHFNVVLDGGFRL